MQVFQGDLKISSGAKEYSISNSNVIRSSMLRLPSWMQGPITWLTTMPVPGQNSNYTSFYQVFTAFLSLMSGLIISVVALKFKENFYLLLFPSLLLTVSGMRKLQVVIYHHCSHGTVMGNRFYNFLLGEFISILLLIKDFSTYKRDHMAHHNSKKLLTYEDETSQDLAEIGIVPGLPKAILWQRLILSFLSPFAHVRWILNRVRSCFLSLNWLHNICALTFWGAIFFVVNYFHLWNDFFIAWLFPLTFLYHISRILRLVAEHRWPTPEIMRSRGLMFICLTTVAVFNGEECPPKTGRFFVDIGQLSRWIIRMVCIHLFARIFVLVGDTPCHDYHHRRPNAPEWSSYISSRQKDKNNGCMGYPINYTEVWGLFNAIDRNLQSLSESKI